MKYMLMDGDWTAPLDFADQQLRGIDHHRRFDQFPPEPVPQTPDTARTNPMVAP